jgi:hypothetical protein
MCCKVLGSGALGLVKETKPLVKQRKIVGEANRGVVAISKSTC